MQHLGINPEVDLKTQQTSCLWLQYNRHKTRAKKNYSDSFQEERDEQSDKIHSPKQSPSKPRRLLLIVLWRPGNSKVLICRVLGF